jgi:hypothetical protein
MIDIQYLYNIFRPKRKSIINNSVISIQYSKRNQDYVNDC